MCHRTDNTCLLQAVDHFNVNPCFLADPFHQDIAVLSLTHGCRSAGPVGHRLHHFDQQLKGLHRLHQGIGFGPGYLPLFENLFPQSQGDTHQ